MAEKPAAPEEEQQASALGQNSEIAEQQNKPILTPDTASRLMSSDLLPGEVFRKQLSSMAAPAMTPEEESQSSQPQPVSFTEELTGIAAPPAMDAGEEKGAEAGGVVGAMAQKAAQEQLVAETLNSRENTMRDKIASGTATPDEVVEYVRKQQVKNEGEKGQMQVDPQSRLNKILEQYGKYEEDLAKIQESNSILQKSGSDLQAAPPNRLEYVSPEDVQFVMDGGYDLPPAIAAAFEEEMKVYNDAKTLKEEEDAQRDLANKQEASQKVAIEVEQKRQGATVQAKEKVQKRQDELEAQYTSLSDMFENASLGKRIGVSLAIALGGISQGLTGASINPVLDTLDKTFKNNIEMRKLAFKKVAEEAKRKAELQPDPKKQADLRKASADALAAEMRVEDMLTMRELGAVGTQPLTPEQIIQANQTEDTRKRLLRVKDQTYLVNDPAIKGDLDERSGDTDTAVDALNQLIQLSKDGAQIPLTKARAVASALQQAAVGKLRLPLTGPGPLTDTEFTRLLGAMGSATSPFKVPALEREKMKAIRDLLVNDMKNRYEAQGIKMPKTRREMIFDDLRNQFPDASATELTKAAIKRGLIEK